MSNQNLGLKNAFKSTLDIPAFARDHSGGRMQSKSNNNLSPWYPKPKKITKIEQTHQE